MREFYLYSEKQIHNTIKEMFINFEIHMISIDILKKNNFINQNILLITKKTLLEDLNSSLFLRNNVVVFFTTNDDFKNKFFFDAKVFNKHININKFIDEVTISFDENLFDYEDIKISGEKIINKKTEREIFLTNLEKNILILLFDQKQIEKKYLLENVLKLNKNTETKTIESHLTRIRNKLSKINSKLKILSKGDKIFLTY
jgi:hypothetical protein|tara:strand:- start:88 stop:690 length:603 start_codon:yes stop_codon:yes gene_type:complete